MTRAWYIHVATGFGLGYLPRMPGTWGSLLGLALAYMLSSLGLGLIIVSLAGFMALGFYVIQKTEADWGRHDSGEIVIDEVLGQCIGLVFLPPQLWLYITGFILFRALDIYKPGIIGWLDRHVQGAWGTLLDDIAAGAATALLLFLIPV